MTYLPAMDTPRRNVHRRRVNMIVGLPSFRVLFSACSFAQRLGVTALVVVLSHGCRQGVA